MGQKLFGEHWGGGGGGGEGADSALRPNLTQ